LDEIKGEIARKSKFRGQLRAKLKNIKTKDQSVKDACNTLILQNKLDMKYYNKVTSFN
jgi:hypothetical protein